MSPLANETVLVTGAAGLIGTALLSQLGSWAGRVVPIDMRASDLGSRVDIRDRRRIGALMRHASGIVHLAAISRVADAERNTGLCQSVNVEGTKALIRLALQAPRKPWFLFASSREVYGEQDEQPVSEDARFRPKNVYARSKVAAERLLEEARCSGVAVSIVRYSNVYGSTRDHPTRVLPAFAYAAIEGRELRVEGPTHELDFTHVDDVASGTVRVAEILAHGEMRLPPIHFVSGVSTTLGRAAELARSVAATRASIVEVPARKGSVARFVGNPERANTLVGWRSKIDIVTGLSRLISDILAEKCGTIVDARPCSPRNNPYDSLEECYARPASNVRP
jgi:nucleoside-diphosphate-sugar epimerase